MRKKIGVAMIGCGGIAHPHLASWQAAADLCEVRALADPNPSALAALQAKTSGAAAYADYAELLRRDDIQIVEILTPPGAHYQNALDAIDAGKDVLVLWKVARPSPRACRPLCLKWWGPKAASPLNVVA